MAQRKKPPPKPPPKKRAPRDERTGQFRTTLTEALLGELCRTHRKGDFRNMTALRCGVHPKRLSIWLRQGAELEDDSLLARLFLEFARIEGDVRAECITEVRNPETRRRIETAVAEDGTVTPAVETARSVTGITWYLERRFRQWRADWTPREDEGDVGEFLVQQSGSLSLDAAKYIVAQLARNMPGELLPLFTAAGWRPPGLSEETADAEAPK